MTDQDLKTSKKKPGRKKGTKKTGGRVKGTPNRNSLTVLTSLDKANIPLVEFLTADIMMMEPAQRVNEWFRLMAHCYPKLKDIEIAPYLPPSPGGAPSDAGSSPAARTATTLQERLALIRGQVPGKPAASG